MPILSTEIQIRLSGGSANANQNASLGGAMSSTSASASLFDAVASAEATAGRTEYRCVYIRNGNTTLTASNVRVWFSVQSSGSKAFHAIGVGTAGINGTEQTIANEATDPVGVGFSNAVDLNNAVNLGTLAPSQFVPVWIQRIVPAFTAPGGTDGFTLSVTVDSPP